MSNIDADLSPDGEQITIDDYREAQKRAAKAERTADLQGRELAMLKAGIPTGTKVAQAFVKDYDGDLADAEKIRSAAIEWGLWKPEGSDANPATPSTPADQAQVDADRAALQNAGAAPNLSEQPPSRAPGEEGLEEFDRRLKSGTNRETASAEVINRITTAAIHEDPRAIVQPWTRDQLGYS